MTDEQRNRMLVDRLIRKISAAQEGTRGILIPREEVHRVWHEVNGLISAVEVSITND